MAGDPARLAAGVTGLVGQGYAVTLCAATAPGAARLSSALAAEGVHAAVLKQAPGTAGVCVVAAPLTSGFILPDAKVAVLSETDVTGRRVPHRRARPRALPRTASSTTSRPGASSCTASTGWRASRA